MRIAIVESNQVIDLDMVSGNRQQISAKLNFLGSSQPVIPAW